jgi:hypothetical protein
MAAIGVPELIILLAIGVTFGVTAFAKLRRAPRAGGRTALRAIAFAAGAAYSFVVQSFLAGAPVVTDWMALARSGITWLIVFEIIHATRAHLRLSTLPVYVIVSAILMRALSIAMLVTPIIGLPDESLRAQFLSFYSDPIAWVNLITAFPGNVLNLVSATTLVVLSYFMINRHAHAGMGAGRMATWSGAKGGSMSPERSQTTRLLCASAVLLGSSFRKEVVDYLENQSRAVAPELGVDVGVVARVCKFVDQRRRAFDWYLSAALLVGLIVAAALDPIAGAILFVVASIPLYFVRAYSEQLRLLEHFRRENFHAFVPDVHCPAALSAETQSGLPRENQNLIVYTGFTPFVGAGTDLGGWSFAIDVSKSREGIGQASSFDVESLYGSIDDALFRTQLDGLVITDCYFVNGREIRGDAEIQPELYQRPLQKLDARTARKYFAASDSRVRHYQWIRIHDWDQELVASFFLRCSLRGRTMFVEIGRFMMTPLAARYRGIDAMSRKKSVRIAAVALESVFAGPIYALVAPFVLFNRLAEAVQEMFGGKERQRRKAIDENPEFDFGAGQGLRNAFASGQFAHYFQKADGDFYMKILERAMLDRIITFLDEHHVDTSELRERQTMILNSGVIVQGGNLNADSLAVGQGAQAIRSQVVNTKSAKGA